MNIIEWLIVIWIVSINFNFYVWYRHIKKFRYYKIGELISDILFIIFCGPIQTISIIIVKCKDKTFKNPFYKGNNNE
jgi:hypothetical protein